MSRITEFASSFQLSEPGTFLHSIDLDADQAVLFKTSRDLLAEASFVDGRSDIALTAPESVELKELLNAPVGQECCDRYIFNVAFCGSTLLGRLLDVPGRSLVLKEPKCLTDLAAWKTLRRRSGRPTDGLGPALRMARHALRRPFAAGEAVTVKAACWVNGMLEEFIGQAEKLLPLFVVIDRPGFLRAVLRGGPERMGHTARLAWHMASTSPADQELLKSAAHSAPDEVGRAANLAMLAHHLQMESFERAMRIGGWGNERVIDFDLIARSPIQAATKACHALGLGLHQEEREHAVERHAGLHAKEPSIPFSTDELRGVDRSITAFHRRSIEGALAWAQSALGPEAAVRAGQAAAA